MSKRTSHSPPGVTPPAIGAGKRGEAGYLGYLLRQAAHAQRKRMDRILAPLGLTHPQFLVLTMIRAYPGCSNAELARLTMLTPQTVHALVAALLQREWVARQAPPAHGRVRPLELSATGEQRLDRARRAALTVERRAQHSLSAEELTVVRRWLVQLARDGADG